LRVIVFESLQKHLLLFSEDHLEHALHASVMAAQKLKQDI